MSLDEHDFETKEDSILYLLEELDRPRGILKQWGAEIICEPWGEDTLEKIDAVADEHTGNGEEPAISIHRVVMILVEESGLEPQTQSMYAGMGRISEQLYTQNMNKLIEEYDLDHPKLER